VLALVLVPISLGAQDNKPDAERALRDIDTFTSMQARTDPHYAAVEEIMLTEVDAILRARPPREWAQAIRGRYVALSEAAHASEAEKIRQDELQSASGFAGPEAEREAAWRARTSELENLLKGGRLGPREHALRAVEIAKLYLPEDRGLLAWRRAKVPIATAYEMGAISRAEYEERWQRTTAYFLDRQAANDRQRTMVEVQIAAEELRIQQRQLERRAGPSFGDRIRQQQGIRCTSTTAFGTTTTTCR
jgi:hypothetical protein